MSVNRRQTEGCATWCEAASSETSLEDGEGRGRTGRERARRKRWPASPDGNAASLAHEHSHSRGNTLQGFEENGSSQGQNLALTVLYVPGSLDSGRVSRNP